MIIAFDVDDTLLIPSVATGLSVDTPNYETIAIYKWFQSQGHYMVVWSGSGVGYAEKWAEKLGLAPNAVYVKQKTEAVDIAFDDCDVDLAKVNVKVKRINNKISRKEWNANKTGYGDAD
jgi:phosphoserine phosphatase